MQLRRVGSAGTYDVLAESLAEMNASRNTMAEQFCTYQKEPEDDNQNGSVAL